jgi:hypothetical protein
LACCIGLAPSGYLLTTAGISPGLEKLFMKLNTKENSIILLKKLRDVYQSQLDTSVIAEIDAVIATLEDETSCSCPEKNPEELGMRVLAVICDVVRIVTNITDLMN